MVVLIEDNKVAVEGQVIGFTAQDTGTDGMESAETDPTGSLAELGVHAVFDLKCGFICECDGNDVEGTDPKVIDEVGDALCKDLGLTRAWACQHDDRAEASSHGIMLLGVQSVREVHRTIVIECGKDGKWLVCEGRNFKVE